MALHADTQPLCFILAPAYHGASMLSWRLNHHPNILSFGVANPQRDGEQICSCGKTVKECPFWSTVFSAIEPSEDDKFTTTLLPQAPHLADSKTINTWLNSAIAIAANEVGPRSWKMVYEPAERFFGIYDKYLTALREWEPHKIYVDAERSNLKFLAMATMGFPVKCVIHLTRDPRAYVAAWKKHYPESTVENLTLEWAAAHTRIKRLQNLFPQVAFLRVKYEDLLEQPVDSYEKIVAFLRQKFVLVDELTIDYQKNHMLGINSNDTAEGFAPRKDEKGEILHQEDQDRVLKVAGPLFSEFGYKRENLA